MCSLAWLSSPGLSSPVLAQLSRLIEPLGSLGSLSSPSHSTVAGGGGTGAAGAAGAGAGGVVPGTVGTMQVTTSPVVPAMMMSSVLPGIGIGLLAGTVIAELLIGKNGEKTREYRDTTYQPYGYSGYKHDLYGHHRGYH